MAKNNIANVLEHARYEVLFTAKDLKENPEVAAEWSDVGDKGVPFAWFDGEVFSLPDPEDICVYGRSQKIGKKSYKMLFTILISDRQGAVEVPVSIFRRIPYLPEEVEVLKKENTIGAPLLSQMPDLKRFEMLVALIGNKSIIVSSVLLHRAGWDNENNKPIPDSIDLDEKDRHQLVCYRYNVAA